MKKRPRNLEIQTKMTFLPPKVSSMTVPHKYVKTHFPSIDANITRNSFSKFYKADESNNNLSNSLTKATFSGGAVPIKQPTPLILTPCKNEFPIKEEKICDLDLNKYAKPVNKFTFLTRRKKNIAKSMNLNLEELSLKKLQNSVLSTNNDSQSQFQFRRSKIHRIPSYILENKAKINLALQMKEPLLVLECKGKKIMKI